MLFANVCAGFIRCCYGVCGEIRFFFVSGSYWGSVLPTQDLGLWIRTWPQCIGQKGRLRTFCGSIVHHIVPKKKKEVRVSIMFPPLLFTLFVPFSCFSVHTHTQQQHTTHNTRHHTRTHTHTAHNTTQHHHHHQQQKQRHTTHNTQRTTHNATTSIPSVPTSFVSPVESGPQPSRSAAQRRRERRLRSMLWHERMTVAMALPESTHLSSRGQKNARAGVWGHEQNYTATIRDPPHTPARALRVVVRRGARRRAA